MIWIDGYPIDLAITEALVFASEITDHPVENDSDISDHIRNLPVELSLECLVSDTPTGDIALDDTRLSEGIDVALPVEDAYAKLLEVRAAKRVVVVECSFGIFENMGIKNLSPMRDAKTTGGLFFQIAFKQLRLIELRRVTVQVAVPIAKRGKPVGKKTGPQAAGVPRRVDKHDGTWFDPDINAWREGASQNNAGAWSYYKGKPLGINERNLTDAQYRDIIAKRRDGALVSIQNKNGVPGPVSQKDLASGNFDVMPSQHIDADASHFDPTSVDTDEGPAYRPLDTPIDMNPDGTPRTVF